jgi:transcriptional regulator with XRE-family HTH domain
VVKKHSSIAIGAKLAKAEALEQRGVAQRDICRQLGISVMTLHRWRKRSSASTDIERSLRLENHRLRNIATDILLRIHALEEARAELPVVRQRPQRRRGAATKQTSQQRMPSANAIEMLSLQQTAGMFPDHVEDMPAL